LNNKKLGSDFEKEFCQMLADRGYWVHFISPAPNGGQPFDVVAVKNCLAYAFDCKTSVKDIFRIERLEQNQIMAFERWMACGNTEPEIAVKHKGKVYLLPYKPLKELGFIRLQDMWEYERRMEWR